VTQAAYERAAAVAVRLGELAGVIAAVEWRKTARLLREEGEQELRTLLTLLALAQHGTAACGRCGWLPRADKQMSALVWGLALARPAQNYGRTAHTACMPW
jgi:hypothetical protein